MVANSVTVAASGAIAPGDGRFAPDLEAFAEACDEARSVGAVRDVLIGAARQYGVQKLALVTHGDDEAMGSLAVRAHNWDEEAIAQLHNWRGRGRNPVFEGAERQGAPLFWSSNEFRGVLDSRQRLWLDKMAQYGLAESVTQRIDGFLVPASCTLSPAISDPSKLRRAFRRAHYAFHRIIALQRPHIADVDRLTRREQQCVELATLAGQPQRDIARQLGVSIHSIRTTRQRAFQRLGGATLEECVWRAIETGQLFLVGRAGKPKSS